MGLPRGRRSSIAEVEMEIEEGGDAVVAEPGNDGTDGTDDIDGASGRSDSDEEADGKHSEERIAGEKMAGATEGKNAGDGEQEVSGAAGAMAVAEAEAVTRETGSPHDGGDGAHPGSTVGRVEEDAVEGSGDPGRSLSSAMPGSAPPSSVLDASVTEVATASVTAATLVRPPAHRRASSFSAQGKLLRGGRRRASLQSIMATGRQALTTRSNSAVAISTATVATVVGGSDDEVAAAAVTQGVSQLGDSFAPSPPSRRPLPCLSLIHI